MKTSTDTLELLSVAQTAKMMGVSTQTIRNWCASGRFVLPVNLGGHAKFIRHEIIAHIQATPRHAGYASTNDRSKARSSALAA